MAVAASDASKLEDCIGMSPQTVQCQKNRCTTNLNARIPKYPETIFMRKPLPPADAVR